MFRLKKYIYIYNKNLESNKSTRVIEKNQAPSNFDSSIHSFVSLELFQQASAIFNAKKVLKLQK